MDIEDLKNTDWNKIDYHKLKDLLEKFGEREYAEFNRRITPNMEESYGVRMPILRKIANNIGKSSELSAIYRCLSIKNTHDEKLLQGMLLPKFKFLTEEEMMNTIDEYILRINNWALCDSFISSLRPIVVKNKETFLNKVGGYIESSNPWKIRFGLILLNNYYCEGQYLEIIFQRASSVKSEHYYVKMAIAWLISTCYATDKGKTIKFLSDRNIDKWCTNKAIQKIIESHRVPREEKEMVKKLKIQ